MAEIIEITGSGSELQGVGHLSDGRTVFVKGALPGERVRIEVTKEADRFCEASLAEVLEAADGRALPNCGVYGRCGGCAALHMSYACSLQLKRNRVYDALSRIGGVSGPNVLPVIGSLRTEHYRNKAEYAIGMENGRVAAGNRMGRSHHIIPADNCLLQEELSLRALHWIETRLGSYDFAGRVRGLVTRVNREKRMTVVLCADAPVHDSVKKLAAEFCRDIPQTVSFWFCRLKNRPAHALDGECRLLVGEKTMTDTILGLSFELSPQSFFQINPEMTEVLYTKAIDAALPKDGMRLLDVYCGAGTITLTAAKRAVSAVGVEIVAPAIENAKRNAALNGLSDKTRFICADAAKEIPKLIGRGERFDSVILDPPRKGADAPALEAIANAGISTISYVSCNPSTLARDVKYLYTRGYRLEWAQPVDMFPWTEHVETIALLTRV